MIDPTRDRLARFARDLDRERYYLSEAAVEDAWSRRRCLARWINMLGLADLWEPVRQSAR